MVRASQAPLGLPRAERKVAGLSPGYLVAGYLGLLVVVVGGYLVFRGLTNTEKSGRSVHAAAPETEAEIDDAPSPEEAAVRRVYATFHEAMRAGDRARLSQIMAKEKLAEIARDGGAQEIELAKQLYPEKVTVVSVVVTAKVAVLTAKARMGEQKAKGIVDLVKEGADWKVKNVAWNISITNDDSADEDEEKRSARNVARPSELPQLQGTWQGAEVGGGASWTLTFSKGHRLDVRSAAGESYGGEVLIRWDLGVEGDSIPVPPGWGPLDLEIDEASNSEAMGKVSLAAFTRHDTELKICGGAPGYRQRVKSFESPGANFRCMVLTKTADGDPEAESQEPEAPASAMKDKDVGPGEATLLLDGAAQRYHLKIGFFSDTRMKDPTRAMMHFENPGEAHSNARRILLTLDATQTGRHFADGQAIHDSMFNDGPVKVGEMVDGARAAIFKWQADGGQVYPPKIGTRCAINVVSPYTGETDSEFVATIDECLVHSAGIDHQLRNVKLRIEGPIEN